jgi:O-acetyl-ADP-ribose deacetylase (regulator of RNase III)
MQMEVFQGDITRLKVDAIVNAANCSLLGGGGVDGAIHRAAGPELLEACRRFNGCNTGEAVITAGFKLPARYVIHTPGPVWHGGGRNEEQLLRNSYLNSLKRAAEFELATIAFPCISTGVYHFPAELAAGIALDTVRNWDKEHPAKVIFVTFGSENTRIYEALLNN